MTDRPIIFSAPMIRALLDGRKFQTRRVLKLGNRRPEYIGPRGCTDDPSCWGWSDDERGDHWLVQRGNGDAGRLEWSDWQGAYAPGDRLWVREAFRGDKGYDAYPPREWSRWPVHYEADGNRDAREGMGADGRLRPSIHMPRWASRITLTVTDVRVQRLQEISEADAQVEGLRTVSKDGRLFKWGISDRDGLPGNDDHGWHWQDWKLNARDAFHTLWNSLHGADAWDRNPWVCALTFTVQRGNIDGCAA